MYGDGPSRFVVGWSGDGLGWVHGIALGERYLDQLRLKAGELALMNKARTINQNETVTVFM